MSPPNSPPSSAHGTPPPPLVVGPISRTDFVRYQGASGDMNPIHHDEEFARNAGFAAPLGIGMFAAGLLNSWATAWLGAENIRRTRVRWKHPVWPGDVLSCGGEIERVYEEEGEERVDLRLTCRRQTGEIAVQGWTTFVLAEGSRSTED